METRTITLNAKQAKALAHWVNTFAEDYKIHDDLEQPENAQYLAVLADINLVSHELNRGF